MFRATAGKLVTRQRRPSAMGTRQRLAELKVHPKDPETVFVANVAS
ncbi:MAG: hypothetical protein IPJ30_23290 [Acidobacteria bacterium]|nr:hypothetical protein [Acidobacteriota bacterium]